MIDYVDDYFSNDMERKIITGFIMSKEYSSKIESKYRSEYLVDKDSRLLAKMCLRYFRKYNQVPGSESFRTLFDNEIMKNIKIQEDRKEHLTEILHSIDEEYQKQKLPAVDYLVDETFKYFKKISMDNLSMQIKESLQDNDHEDAEKLIKEYRFIERDDELSYRPLDIEDKIKETIEQANRKPIIKMSSKLNKFIGNEIYRKALVCFMGPEKRGKTTLMLDIAAKAINQKKNVIFYQAGDMTKGELNIKLWTYLTKAVLNEEQSETVYYPVLDCIMNQNGSCKKSDRPKNKVIFKNMTETEIQDLDSSTVYGKADKYTKHVPCTSCKNKKVFKGTVWYKKQYIKLYSEKEMIKAIKKKRKKLGIFESKTYITGELTIRKIRNHLFDLQERKKFRPDLVLIDYADILGYEGRGLSIREQQIEIWKDLRALSFEIDGAVITATQADAKSYDAKQIKKGNFSESKNKLAYGTSFFGLNQTEPEKEKGIMRINKIASRFNNSSEKKMIKVLQCPALSRAIISSW